MSKITGFPDNPGKSARKWLEPVLTRLDIVDAGMKQLEAVVNSVNRTESGADVQTRGMQRIRKFSGLVKAEDFLAQLARAKEEHAQYEVLLKAQLDWLANAAHDLGASWKEIGRATGVSSQAAHQRWSGRDGARSQKFLTGESKRQRAITAG